MLKQKVSPHLVVRLGDDVRLSCPVAATPPPMLEWKKDGTQILDAWDRFSLHENMLRVSRVTADDAGVYVCIAVNGFGTMRVATELFVIGEFDRCEVRLFWIHPRMWVIVDLMWCRYVPNVMCRYVQINGAICWHFTLLTGHDAITVIGHYAHM